MAKREQTIRAYQKLVDEKELTTKALAADFEARLRDKEGEIDVLRSEKETLANELTERSAVCQTLVSHLTQFVDFWRRHSLPNITHSGTEASSAVATEDSGGMHSLLNSSQELLNSAIISMQLVN